MREVFAARRDLLVDGLSSIGIKVTKPLATFYIWAHVPKGYTSADFAEMLIEKAGVVVTPGSGFGAEGEGYFRSPSRRRRSAYTRRWSASETCPLVEKGRKGGSLAGPSDILGKKIIITGDVNTGKTTLARAALDILCAAGLSTRITIVDMAPEVHPEVARERGLSGVGGQALPPTPDVAYFTARMAAPRLTSRTEAEAVRLAAENRGKIEALFAMYAERPRENPLRQRREHVPPGGPGGRPPAVHGACIDNRGERLLRERPREGRPFRQGSRRDGEAHSLLPLAREGARRLSRRGARDDVSLRARGGLPEEVRPGIPRPWAAGRT